MAKVQTSVQESVYRIKRWHGVNEAPEGEASLKIGEAAVMRNFKVTAGGALKKRGGSRNVAGLLSGYVLFVDEQRPETLKTESGTSTTQYTMYPTATVDSVGKITLSGTPVTVTNANADSCVGYYYQDDGGAVHQFKGLERTNK